jgi:hypothetical protein
MEQEVHLEYLSGYILEKASGHNQSVLEGQI